jgi:hypothetical protein
MLCSKCGKNAPNGVKFCPACGHTFLNLSDNIPNPDAQEGFKDAPSFLPAYGSLQQQNQQLQQQAEPPKKKKGKGIIVLVIILVLLIIIAGGGVGTYFLMDYLNNQNTVTDIDEEEEEFELYGCPEYEIKWEDSIKKVFKKIDAEYNEDEESYYSNLTVTEDDKTIMGLTVISCSVYFDSGSVSHVYVVYDDSEIGVEDVAEAYEDRYGKPDEENIWTGRDTVLTIYEGDNGIVALYENTSLSVTE